MSTKSTMGPMSILVLFGAFLFVLGVPEVFAGLPTYTPLVNLPGIQEGSTSIPAFINRVYIFTIVIGALLGVVKIALAGAKYSMGDVITNKEEAKKDIMGVLLGLVVLLAPWIVLNTIYPGLLNLDFTKNITNVGVEVLPPPGVRIFTYTCQDTPDTDLMDGGDSCLEKCLDAVEKVEDFKNVIGQPALTTDGASSVCEVQYEVVSKEVGFCYSVYFPAPDAGRYCFDDQYECDSAFAMRFNRDVSDRPFCWFVGWEE